MRTRSRAVVVSIAVLGAVIVLAFSAVLLIPRQNSSGDTAGTPAPVTTTPAAMPITPVPLEALSGLLLTPPEAAPVVGAKQMAANPDYGDKVYEAMADKALVDESCMSLSPGLELTYLDSGFTGSRQQFLKGTDPDRKLVQTVVSFPDSSAAEAHVTAATAKWKACADRRINLAPVGGDPNHWNVADVVVRGTGDDAILTASRTEEGGAGWGCRDGMAARNNIVIDFAVCGEDVPESVLPAFVEAVTGKIKMAAG
ncbi:sensor domain-containing protein [Mycobacterium sp. ACS4331]|uniref:sensor domain-containing protein n=1 Tax=Mycobacterium sp. ACS4331 TaxID=1834121 RepID=UPI0007FE0851|nr:sensor domain-containing protein [Mycobacterium sp. ACS4331]OBF21200.1 hypothetical protein A5727_00855 [Mycobacterium sp. ACS4331]